MARCGGDGRARARGGRRVRHPHLAAPPRARGSADDPAQGPDRRERAVRRRPAGVVAGRGGGRGRAGPAYGRPGPGRRRWPAPVRRGRQVRRRGQPVVRHAVRPRLPVVRADAGALRLRAGALDAAGAGATPGHSRRRLDRGAARQDPPRGPQRRRVLPAPALLRLGRCHPAVRRDAGRCRRLGGRPSRGPGPAAGRPTLPDVADGAVRRHRVDPLRRQHGPRPGQPGLEGQPRLRAVRRRQARRAADRALRGAGLRL